MKLVFLFIALTCNLIFSRAYPQIDKPFYFEFRSGMQQHFNSGADSEHLLGGSDSSQYDKKKHYGAGFALAKPIEAVVGFYNPNKGFRLQFQLACYKQDIALLQQFKNEPPYPLTVSDMMMIKVSILIDALAAFENINHNGDKRVHGWVGLTTGVITPLSFSLNQATADYFGIKKFNQNEEWFLGLDYLITIRITKWGLYLLPAMSLMFPIAGNIGKLEMLPTVEYAATRPIRVFTMNWSMGIGYRFSIKRQMF